MKGDCPSSPPRRAGESKVSLPRCGRGRKRRLTHVVFWHVAWHVHRQWQVHGVRNGSCKERCERRKATHRGHRQEKSRRRRSSSSSPRARGRPCRRIILQACQNVALPCKSTRTNTTMMPFWSKSPPEHGARRIQRFSHSARSARPSARRPHPPQRYRPLEPRSLPTPSRPSRSLQKHARHHPRQTSHVSSPCLGRHPY